MNNYENYLNDLNQDLDCLELEPLDTLTKFVQGIKITTAVIKKLRDCAVSKGFEGKDEEIHFFKYLKPQIFSNLIYYRKLLQIDKLQEYFNTNQEFYHYYRSGATFLDEHYFLRKNADVSLNLDAICFLTDLQFSTSHDSSVAMIMAHNKLILHLKREMLRLDDTPLKITESHRKRAPSKLFWTANKVDLIELIYALYTSGAINRGAANINEIADSFETLLGTDLGDFYRTYSEIRSRKIHRTKFMEKLKESLDQHMLSLDR